LRKELEGILLGHNFKEMKWLKVTNGKREKIARQMLCFAIEKAYTAELRADVLIWDTEDQRHSVPERDDIENLHRMYYHLLRNVLGKRWPDEASWLFVPDENTSIRWSSVEYFLRIASVDTEFTEEGLFSDNSPAFVLRRLFAIDQVMPRRSHSEAFIQLADLFAGIGVYSHETYDEYERWALNNPEHPILFPSLVDKASAWGKADAHRCTLLRDFNGMCKKRKLDVSLKTNRGLRTMHPKYPVNFWMYEPRHELDKAPTKQRT